MFKRMSFVFLSVLLTIWMSLSPAFAGAGIPVRGYGYTSGIETGTAQLVKAGPGIIYDITLNAGASNQIVTVYDTTTGSNVPSATNTIWILEGATANTSTTISFANAPLATSQGIEVSTSSNGEAFLNYQ